MTDAAEIRKLIEIVGQVHVSEAVQRYAVALTTATRRSPELPLGASPRATLHLVRAAKASAAIARAATTSSPTTCTTLAPPVLAHRLLPSVEAAMSGRTHRPRSSSRDRGRRCRCPTPALTPVA